jgi:hypothetical protein
MEEKDGENVTTNSFIIFTLHLTSLRSSNEGYVSPVISVLNPNTLFGTISPNTTVYVLPVQRKSKFHSFMYLS